MVGSDSEEFHRLFYNHCENLVSSVFRPRCWLLVALVAWALYYQYWLYKIPYRQARFGLGYKNTEIVVNCRFCRLEPGAKAKSSKHWDLKLKYLLLRNANNGEFECSQLKVFLPHWGSFEGNKIIRFLFYLLYSNNNRFENGIKRALGPNRSDKSLNSLYL